LLGAVHAFGDVMGLINPLTEEGKPLTDRVDLLQQLAIDCLENYDSGFVDLERLDRDLKSIVRSLSDIAGSAWTNSLLRQWGQLEIIYASALAEGRFALSQDEENDVQEIIAGLINEFRGGDSTRR
jgi:hypothetical protein